MLIKMLFVQKDLHQNGLKMFIKPYKYGALMRRRGQI